MSVKDVSVEYETPTWVWLSERGRHSRGARPSHWRASPGNVVIAASGHLGPHCLALDVDISVGLGHGIDHVSSGMAGCMADVGLIDVHEGHSVHQCGLDSSGCVRSMVGVDMVIHLGGDGHLRGSDEGARRIAEVTKSAFDEWSVLRFGFKMVRPVAEVKCCSDVALFGIGEARQGSVSLGGVGPYAQYARVWVPDLYHGV